jgi:NitT/TauT family transport system substrate-binding protein
MFKKIALFFLLAGFLSRPAPASAGELTKVSFLETTHNLFFAPLYVAYRHGFFEQEGLDVSFSTAQGTDKATAALLGGSADIMLVGPEAAVYVRSSRSPTKVKMFCALTTTDGTFLVGRQKPASPFDWNSLRGKTILGFPPGSTPDVFLTEALRRNGIDAAKDVEVVKNIAPPARRGAFQAGTGDFAQLFEVDISMLEASNVGYPIVNVGNLVGKIDYTMFTATDDFLAKHPAVAQAWTNALAKSLRWTNAASAKDIAETVAPDFPGVSIATLTAALERNQKEKLWKDSPVISLTAVEAFQKLLVTGGVLKPEQLTSPDKIVDNRFALAATKGEP